ncbi:MAG TPA: hypothetical protein VF970_01380 [Gemmatimonadales bacterium]
MRPSLVVAVLLAMDTGVVAFAPRMHAPPLFRAVSDAWRDRGNRGPELGLPPVPPPIAFHTLRLRQLARVIGMTKLDECLREGTRLGGTCAENVGAARVAGIDVGLMTVQRLAWRRTFADSVPAAQARDSLAWLIDAGNRLEVCELPGGTVTLRELHWLLWAGLAIRFELRREAPGYSLTLLAENLDRWSPERRCLPGLPRRSLGPEIQCPLPDQVRFYQLIAPLGPLPGSTGPRPAAEGLSR